MAKLFSVFSGYKTWIAAIGLFVIGVIHLATEYFPIPTEVVVFADNMQAVFVALGLVGIGHKIEKKLPVDQDPPK